MSIRYNHIYGNQNNCINYPVAIEVVVHRLFLKYKNLISTIRFLTVEFPANAVS